MDWPEFRDPGGEVWVWDPSSKTYVRKPSAGLPQPDRGHATGGDNDLFSPNQIEHSELPGVPELEGHMASKTPAVLCPNCQEETDQQACPQCHKDLTPEWNQQQDSQQDWMYNQPEHSDASEFTSLPERVPKRNRMKTDDSFPSTLSYQDAREIGRWVEDKNGSIHFEYGMGDPEGLEPLHSMLAHRHGLAWPEDIGAYGSVYHNGTADVHQVMEGYPYHHDTTAQKIRQAFGDSLSTIYPPLEGQHTPTNEPVEITGGVWLAKKTVGGLAWVKERSDQGYTPEQILCAEHLTPDDHQLYSQGCKAIVTATGGAGSHAASLARSMDIPVVAGVGSDYMKIQTGSYLTIDPSKQTIAVMPDMSGSDPSLRRQIGEQITDYYRQRDPYVQQKQVAAKPYFSSFAEEEAWNVANNRLSTGDATLDDCPQCHGVLSSHNDEKVCHDCGLRQPIVHMGGVLQITSNIQPFSLKSGAMIDDGLLVEAFYNGKRIGHLAAMKNEDGYYVTDDVEVDPQYRRQGIASSMVRKARESVTMIPYASVPNQVYRSEAGKALAFKIAGPALAIIPEVAGIGGGEAAGGLMGGGGMGGMNMGMLMGRAMGGGQGSSQSAPEASPDEMADAASQEREDVAPGAKQAGQFMDDARDLGSEIGQTVKNRLHLDPDAACPQCGTHRKYHGNIIGGAPGTHGECENCGYLDPTFRMGALGDDETGMATDNRGENSTKGDSSGDSWKEQGDSPELLKDVGGGPKSPHAMHGDPELQDKATKAFEMNRPLIIEFADSPESGENHPILKALDELLEAAFPGYRDGMDGDHDPGTTDEHQDTFEDGLEEDSDEPKEDVKPGKEAATNALWGSMEKEAFGDPTMMANPAQPGMPPAAQGVVSQVPCPRCGGMHDPSLPCPQMAQQAMAPGAVGQTPTTGTPPATHVMTHVDDFGDWDAKTAMYQEDADAYEHQQQLNQNEMEGPSFPVDTKRDDWITCQNCGSEDFYPDGTCRTCGVPAKTQQHNPMFLTDLEPEMGEAAPGHFPVHRGSDESIDDYFMFTAEHHHHDIPSEQGGDLGPDYEFDHTPEEVHEDHHHHEDSDWQDDSGNPLEEGADYDMTMGDQRVPDRVTIDSLNPAKLHVTIHSGDIDYQTEITRQDMDTEGYVFTQPQDGQDSMSDDLTQDIPPVRPGQDPTPQVDDLSTPSTVVSSLDEYQGSFAGDDPSTRAHLNEGSAVEVDPALMAKLAGKDYSPREQREFIDESGTARNLDMLDLEGTHYPAVDDLDAYSSLW